MKDRAAREVRYLRQSILLASAAVAGALLTFLLLVLGSPGPSCQPSLPVHNQTSSSCPDVVYRWALLAVGVVWIASCLVGLLMVRRSYRRRLEHSSPGS